MTQPHSFVDGYRLIDGTELNDKFGNPTWSIQSNVSATPGGNVNNSHKVVETITQVTTASVANASLSIPQALPGRLLFIANQTAVPIVVFAEGDSTISAGAGPIPGNIGVTQAAGISSYYIGVQPKQWIQIDSIASGFAANFIETQTNIAALRLWATPAAQSPAIMALVYNTVQGDGGGLFYLDAADHTTPDNGTTVIVDAVGNRWKRELVQAQYIALTDSGNFFTSTNVEGALAELGTLQLANIAALRLVTPVSSTQTAAVHGYYTNGDGGGGIFWGVTGAAVGTYVDNGGTVIVPTGGDGSSAWIRQYSGAINVRWFGAKGDGATDDNTAFQNAIAFCGTVAGETILFIPGGKYLYSQTLDFRSVSVQGSNPGGPGATVGILTELVYTGTGTAMVCVSYRGATWSGFTLTNNGAAQDGILVLGAEPVLTSIYIRGFSGVSLRLGSGTQSTIVPLTYAIPVAGAYYAKVDNVNIANTTITGANALRGVFNDGGFPSTNANSFRNVIVSGRFDILYEINGTNNSFYGGDCDPDNTIATPTAAYKIGGTNIRVHEPYYELRIPTYLFWFTSTSFSCLIDSLHFQGSPIPDNMYSKILDEGWANNVKFLPVGFNYPYPATNTSALNLIPNSAFKLWGTDAYGAAVPVNWSQNGLTAPVWSQDTTTTRGAYASATVTIAAQTTSLTCFVASANANNNSANQVKIEDFRGKTVVAAVWCKATAAIGNLKIFGGGAQYGNNSYTGSGNWELLTAICKVEAAATDLSITLRQNSANTAATGQMWFSEPMLIAGVELRQPERRALTDDNANMYGMFSYAQSIDVTLPGGVYSFSVANGNVFNFTAASVATTLSGFTGGKPGQMIFLYNASAAAVTLQYSASTVAANVIKTRTSANIVMAANTVYAFVLMKGGSTVNQWYQVFG